MTNFISNEAINELIKDANIFGTHMTGVATLTNPKGGDVYVVLVTQPSSAPCPIGIVFNYSEANDLALSLFEAAKTAKEHNKK
jgi:hypothetical protein